MSTWDLSHGMLGMVCFHLRLWPFGVAFGRALALALMSPLPSRMMSSVSS